MQDHQNTVAASSMGMAGDIERLPWTMPQARRFDIRDAENANGAVSDGPCAIS